MESRVTGVYLATVSDLTRIVLEPSAVQQAGLDPGIRCLPHNCRSRAADHRRKFATGPATNDALFDS